MRSRLNARRSKPRRGRVVDRQYTAWLAGLGCLVCGKRATVHHVRQYGSPKNDTRTLPLCPEHHQIQAGLHSIEALGKRKFEAMYGVDLETAIRQYNERYERSDRVSVGCSAGASR